MSYKRIYGISACDPRGVMGKEGKLPWHCEKDLQHFSDTISHHPIVMGYRTFHSLPSHFFHQRRAIVFTRKEGTLSTQNMAFIPSITAFLDLINTLSETSFYVIGGAEIYGLFLKENLIEEFILTEFKDSYDGDTFFPLSLLAAWPHLTIFETTTYVLHQYFNPSASRLS